MNAIDLKAAAAAVAGRDSSNNKVVDIQQAWSTQPTIQIIRRRKTRDARRDEFLVNLWYAAQMSLSENGKPAIEGQKKLNYKKLNCSNLSEVVFVGMNG